MDSFAFLEALMPKESFTPLERQALALKAVNRLIADAQANRLFENKELAEVIAICVQESTNEHLLALEFLLSEQELERPDLERRDYLN